jgi:hypothetical protein
MRSWSRELHRIPVDRQAKNLRRSFGQRAVKVAQDFQGSAKLDEVRDYWSRVIQLLEAK